MDRAYVGVCFVDLVKELRSDSLVTPEVLLVYLQNPLISKYWNQFCGQISCVLHSSPPHVSFSVSRIPSLQTQSDHGGGAGSAGDRGGGNSPRGLYR